MAFAVDVSFRALAPNPGDAADITVKLRYNVFLGTKNIGTL